MMPKIPASMTTQDRSVWRLSTLPFRETLVVRSNLRASFPLTPSDLNTTSVDGSDERLLSAEKTTAALDIIELGELRALFAESRSKHPMSLSPVLFPSVSFV